VFLQYTGESSLLVEYLPKIQAVAELLMRRRALALTLPSTDPAYGCLTGNDEAVRRQRRRCLNFCIEDDHFAKTGSKQTQRKLTQRLHTVLQDLFGPAIDPRFKTEMAFMSITAEAWRGFRDLGRAMTALGAAEQHEGASGFGRELSGNATLLWSTFRGAMEKNVLPAPAVGGPRCRPYVFGARGGTCGQLPPSSAPSQRDSESWRTYSEAAYSGALLKSEMAEILSWHKLNPTENGMRKRSFKAIHI